MTLRSEPNHAPPLPPVTAPIGSVERTLERSLESNGVEINGAEMNGFAHKAAPTEREQQIKEYYRKTENYDWTNAVDRFIGPETLFHRARCQQVMRLIKRVAVSGRYLDVGCGTALMTRRLPPHTVGLDLNPRNLAKARKYAPQASFLICDAEGQIPLASSSFDLAVCTEMLEHLLYPERALAEIRRVLKPGGLLIGSVPGRSVIWKLRWMSRSKGAFVEEPYHKHYRREEVRQLISQHFSLEQLYSKHWQMNWFFAGRKAR